MTPEHRITYIANIYDEKRVAVNVDEVKTEDFIEDKTPFLPQELALKSESKSSIQRVNPRHKLFCKCGGSAECKVVNKVNVAVTVKQMEESRIPGNYKYYNIIKHLSPKESIDTGIYGYIQSDTEFEPIVCPQCGCIYDNYNQVEILTAHNGTGQNISRVRTIVFENEKTLALCCFANKLILNHRSKKLFSKEIKHFISYNKNKGFFVRGGTIRKHTFIRKFGLRFIPNNIKEVIWEFSKIQNDRVLNGLASAEKSEIDMMSAMDEFCERLLLLINKSDAERLSNMLADKLSIDIGKLYEDLPNNILHPEYKSIFNVKHDCMFKYKLPTIMAVVIYPPIATMFLTKGLEFTLGLINSWIVPTTRIIKKEFPTSPVKILEFMIKLKMIEDSSNRRSMEKGYKKAEKLSTKTKVVPPKRYYKYDDKIPNDIKYGDKRISAIKITKNIFRNLREPEFADALLLASLSQELLPANYMSLVEKYGLDACAEPFRQMTMQGRARIGLEKIEHVIRLCRKFLNNLQDSTEYNYSAHTIRCGIIKPKVMPLDMYADTIRIMDLMNRDHSELMGTKDFDDVKIIHDRLVGEYAAIKNEELDVSVKKSMAAYKHMDCIVDDVSFTVLDGIAELNLESAEMHHCVRTYAHSVANGSTIIFRIKDLSDGSRATLGTHTIDTNKKTISFTQLKSIHNAPATNRIKKSVVKFMKKNNIQVESRHFEYDLEGASVPEKFIYDDVADMF